MDTLAVGVRLKEIGTRDTVYTDCAVLHSDAIGLVFEVQRTVSEGGTIAPPAAIANAVADALGGLGIDSGAVDAYPMTAPRVLRLLARSSAARPPVTG